MYRHVAKCAIRLRTFNSIVPFGPDSNDLDDVVKLRNIPRTWPLITKVYLAHSLAQLNSHVIHGNFPHKSAFVYEYYLLNIRNKVT